MSTYHVYGLGAALVDTEIEVTDAFLASAGVEKGVMTLVDEARQHELMDALKDHLVASKRASGGSACNSVIAANYFGAKTFYSGKVANDDNGQFFIDDLKQAKVAFHSAEADHGITGKCLVMITPDAERTMNTFLGINDELTAKEVDFEAITQSSYLYIEGYLVTSEARKNVAIDARKHAEKHGVKTALSLSDPGIVGFFHDGLTAMVGAKIDVLFCNKDEALAYTKTDSLDAAAEALKTCTASFAITLGADGALIFDGKSIQTIEGQAAKAIDTNGAGDMFAGAFLYAITHGKDYASAAKFANAAAAQVVSQFGPRLEANQHTALKQRFFSE